LAFGRRLHPNASETDPNASEYLTAEQTASPAREGGPMRWVWVLQRRVASGIFVFTGTEIPPEQIELTPTPTGRAAGSEFFVFVPTGEPEQVAECQPNDTEATVQQVREERTSAGAIIIRVNRQTGMNVLYFQMGSFERVVMPTNGGEQPQPPAMV
jgi:hypothetical protein